jgi:O-antigen ligase
VVVGGGATAVLGVVQVIAGQEHPSSTYGNPTFATEFLVPLLLICLPLAHLGRWKVAVAAGVPIATYLLLLFAAGRARADLLALLAGAATIGLLLWLGRKKVRVPAWLLTGALLAAAVAAPFLVDFGGGAVYGRTDTVEIRRHLRSAGWEMLADRPVTGYGLGGYEAEYPARRDPEEFRLSGGRHVSFAHNLPAQVAAEAGVPGLLLLLFLLWVPLASAVRSILREPDDATALAAAAGMVAILVSAQFSAPLLHPASATLFVLLGALAVARRHRRYVTDLKRRFRRVVPVVILLVPAIAGAVALARHLVADALLHSAVVRARGLEGGLDEEAYARLRASVAARPLPEALRLAAFYETGTGDPETALGTLRDLFRISPHDEPGLVEQARALLASGEPEVAIRALDDLVADRPGDDLVLRLRARAHGVAGDRAAELADYLAAAKEAEPEVAADVAREVSLLAPEHVLAFVRAAERIGGEDPEWGHAVLAGLDSPEAVYTQAVLHATHGGLDEAMRVLRRAVAEGAAGRDRLLYDPRLEPLRGRADFRELLR